MSTKRVSSGRATDLAKHTGDIFIRLFVCKKEINVLAWEETGVLLGKRTVTLRTTCTVYAKDYSPY
jgi:hypothetical protein